MSVIDFTDLIYDPKTGFFCRVKNPEKQIGTVNKQGYVVFRHKGVLVYAHRVAFQICHGFLPKIIDHINGNKSDNKICNLRAANNIVNNHNRKAKGFAKPKQTKKWSASITVNKKRIHIGYFNSPEEANKAYLEAKKIYHPTAPDHLFAV